MGEVGLSVSMPMSKVLGARLVGETDMNQTQPNTGNRLEGLVLSLVCLIYSQTGSGITVWELWLSTNRDVQGDAMTSIEVPTLCSHSLRHIFVGKTSLHRPLVLRPSNYGLIACPSPPTIGSYHQEFSYYYPALGKYLAPKI